jgi:hypothetical protein
MQLPAPALITLDGHRRSRLYRDSDPTLKSSWFKYSGEREGQRPSFGRHGEGHAGAFRRAHKPRRQDHHARPRQKVGTRHAR